MNLATNVVNSWPNPREIRCKLHTSYNVTFRPENFPSQTHREFQGFYVSLYNLQRDSPSQTQVTDYLANSQMPKLSAEVSKLLDEPITLEEIQSTIGTTKLGKAPGPDGLTLSYYKTSLPSLCKFMHKFFNSLGFNMAFPRDTLSAHIAVIPKEGKDPTSCGSYRPISLLNTDLKFFTKLLAIRIQQHWTELALYRLVRLETQSKS